MISIKETAVVGHIHVCDAYASPCDDPESQMVVPIGSEGSVQNHTGDTGRVERSI